MTTDEKGPEQDPEARLAEAIRIPDALPPEEVRQMILDMGAIDPALDAIRKIALRSDDADARAEARSLIERFGLGILLLDEGGSEPGAADA